MFVVALGPVYCAPKCGGDCILKEPPKASVESS